MKNQFFLFSIPFDQVTQKEAVDFIFQTTLSDHPSFIVTPNPEICLHALSDQKFLSILKTADLSIPDGFGILWAARYCRGKLGFLKFLWTLLTPWQTINSNFFQERVTGTDVMEGFLKKYKTSKIFLLGADPEVNASLSERLRSEGVNIVGNFSGDESTGLEEKIRSLITSSGAEVLFVAFGAPKQEKWIFKNLLLLPTVKAAIGVGGAFDFLSGKMKRAPYWLRKIGLEWMFRIFREPSRIRRIINATIVFPWKVYRLHK